MRDRLMELLKGAETKVAEMLSRPLELDEWLGVYADYLIANGVIVTPCVAMVEQFIKDGKLDRKCTAHNGKYAVVYVDKSKWNCPLIDITEQFYNTEKAEERIQELKGSASDA